MSTLTEIEAAAERLSDEDKRRLMLSIAESIGRGDPSRPPPRLFTVEEMQRWLDEDERVGREFLARQTS